MNKFKPGDLVRLLVSNKAIPIPVDRYYIVGSVDEQDIKLRRINSSTGLYLNYSPKSLFVQGLELVPKGTIEYALHWVDLQDRKI